MFWGGKEEVPLDLKFMRRGRPSVMGARGRRASVSPAVSRRTSGIGLPGLAGLVPPGGAPRAGLGGRQTLDALAAVDPDAPIFRFSVFPGVRGEWFNFSISGNGPVSRQYWANRGFYEALMFNWRRTFVSLTKEKLYFFTRKLTAEPVLTLAILEIATIDCELGSKQTAQSINPRALANTLADSHNIELRTRHGSTLLLRLCDAKSRNMWLYYLREVHSAAVSRDQ